MADRVERLATWLDDLDARVRATEIATGDEKTAKELRRAIEALAKHDPKLEKRLTERVDVLSERLATLAETVSTTASALARKDGELNALRKELEESRRRAESLARERGGVDAKELEKLRASVQAVAEERPARGSDKRVEDLRAKIELLTERVDTLSKTVATTAAGLAGREGDIAVLRHQLEAGSARIEQATLALRRSQDDASVAGRLDVLQASLDETSERLSARERDLAAVRTRIDEAYSRVGTVVAQIQTSITSLSSQVAALEALPEATEDALAAHAADVRSRLEGLAARLDSLAQAVEAAVREAGEQREEVHRLDARVGEAAARLDALGAELADALGRLDEPRTHDAAVDAKLEALDRALTTVREQLAVAESASTARAADGSSRADARDRSLAALVERLDQLEHDGIDTAGRLQAAVSDWSQDRARVWERLEALAEGQAVASEAGTRFEPVVDALASRLASLEEDRTAVATEIERLTAVLDSERRALDGRIEELAAAGESTRAEELEVLQARLEAVEADRAALASETARIAAQWSAVLDDIESRLARAESASEAADTSESAVEPLLAELARRLDALEQDRRDVREWLGKFSEAWQGDRSAVSGRLDEVADRLTDLESALADAQSPASGADDVAQLRVAVDGLRMRLAASEQELAARAPSKDVAARLDELTRRLEALERAPVVIAGAGVGPEGLLPGDGRFRLELRALELRMEHAEAAARENREAVLVQLERLAARIEWRFQRLEEEYEARRPTLVGGGGQVVPLRPET